MPAPCGGCPPCCPQCVFGQPAKTAGPATVVVPKADYGCIKPDAGDIVKAGGVLGMMRGSTFHPVTAAGAQFLHASGNALAQHC